MNCPTTRCSTPAAAPRTGPGVECAPGDPIPRPSIPFAALPHDIAADPRLSPHRFAGARRPLLLRPGRGHLLALRQLDRCPGPRHPETVRRSLRHLEDLGYIRREPSRENPTGRLIHLTCREPDWERPRQAPVPSLANRGDRPPARLGGSSRRTPKETWS